MDIAFEDKRRRAHTERPYIHYGKCCDFAGKQCEFVIFACREAKRLPYDTHGRLCNKVQFKTKEQVPFGTCSFLGILT